MIHFFSAALISQLRPIKTRELRNGANLELESSNPGFEKKRKDRREIRKKTKLERNHQHDKTVNKQVK